METKNVLEEVTKKLLLLLDKVSSGDIETWIPLSGLAYNPYSVHQYSALNQLLLSLEMYEKNYSHNNWLTFKQIKAKGGSVIPESKSTPVTFTDTAYTDEDDKPITAEQAKIAFRAAKAADPDVTTYFEIGISTRRFLKLYQVFNVAQTTGLPDNFVKPQCAGLSPIERHQMADEIIGNSKAVVVHVSGNSAHYNASLDKIQMPMSEQFKSKEMYYSVQFHELIHWTRHPTRLNRKFDETVKDDYAFEELVAELGSAFLCAEIGISAPVKSNAAYIKSWLAALENNRNYLLKAVSYAERAMQYLMKQPSITV